MGTEHRTGGVREGVMMAARCYPLSFEGGPQSEDRPPAKQCVARTLTTARARAVHCYSQTWIIFSTRLTFVTAPLQVASA